MMNEPVQIIFRRCLGKVWHRQKLFDDFIDRKVEVSFLGYMNRIIMLKALILMAFCRKSFVKKNYKINM